MLLDRIWAQQPGTYFFLCTKTRSGKWAEHPFKRSQFGDLRQFIEDYRDREIYFCPHGFSKPKRLKPYAVMPNLLWADLDEADPRDMKIKPSIALESSPGRYVGLWVTDGPVTEELNRRLSYSVGADNSGWDLTQVLRVPGTTNHKYHSMPRVRTLWQDGDTYKVSWLEKQVPKEATTEREDSNEESDAAAIFKKWERKLPPWLRRELLNGKPVEGKRSEMFWKISQTLIETGVSTEEAFVLLKASPWNKFAGRRNEDEQIDRELDKAINHHMPSGRRKALRESRDNEDGDKRRLIFRPMSEVEEADIEWMWEPYFAKGELTILEGDPGLGKSYLMEMVSLSFADNRKLPTDDPNLKHRFSGKTLYFDMENSADSVTKKRLRMNGIENESSFVQCEEPFSIDDDDAMDEVYEYIEKEKPSLVVFDTLNTYIGKADAFKGHEAQQAIGEFREIARRFHICVVVLRHLTKGGKERALYRGQGSISFTGMARVVITVGTMPEEPDTRVMAVTKINVAKAPRALSFTVEALPPKGKDRNRSRFVWGEYIDLTAEDIIAAPQKSAGPSEKDEAMEFLKAQLESEPKEVSKLERMAESRGISRRTLHRAADSMGIGKKVKGFGKEKRSFWHLQPEGDQD